MVESSCLWLFDSRSSVIADAERLAGDLDLELKVWGSSSEGIVDFIRSGRDLAPQLILVSEVPADSSLVDFVYSLSTVPELATVPIVGLSDENNWNLRDVTNYVGMAGWIRLPLTRTRLETVLERIQSGTIRGDSEHRRVRFDVKMGRLSIIWRHNSLVLRGVLSQQAGLERIEEVVPADVETVVVNWSELECLGMDGVSKWLQFVESDFGRSKKFVFQRCPLMMCELFELMPEFPGGEITIESVIIPMSSSLRFELARTMGGSTSWASEMMDNQLHYVFSASGDWRELVYEPETCRAFMEIRHVNRFDLPLAKYLAFFHTIQRYMLSEFFITRESILDQVSRVSARIGAVGRVLNAIGGQETFSSPDRSDMIQMIQKLYDPILALLVVAERVLHHMRLKSEVGFAQDSYSGNRFKPLLKVMTADVFDEVHAAVESAGLLQAEQSFEANPCTETLDALILSGLEVVGVVMNMLVSIVNDLGMHVMEIMKEYMTIEERVVEAIEGMENRDSSNGHERTGIADVRFDGLLDLDGPLDESEILLEIAALVSERQVEMDRITFSLATHDVMSQCCEHRSKEIGQLSSGMEDSQIGEKIAQAAVTILEKRILQYYYPGSMVESEEDESVSGSGVLELF